MDALQSVVRTTTQKLMEGTRQWEADRRSLKRVTLQLRNTEQHVAAAQGQADAGQAKLDVIALRLYTGGARGSLDLAFTQSPEDFVSAVQGIGLAERAMGSTSDVIALAATAKLRLQQKQAESEDLAGEAEALADRSARRLVELQAMAARMSDQLTAAESALQAARARKAAALEAAAREAAAEAARDKASRERAALARAARERAARTRSTFAGGPACTGRSTQGQANGNLDPASLCPLWMAPGHRLRGDAAAAFNSMSKHRAATVGQPLCVTDSYRSYSAQVDVYRRKPGLAAVPGTSEHGWGKAVDFCGGVQSHGSAAYNWMKANAGRFGWFHPDWAEPSGSKPEAWHWEFSG